MEKPVLMAPPRIVGARVGCIALLRSGRAAFGKRLKIMKYILLILALSVVILDMYLLFRRKPEQGLLSDHSNDGP
jgi:hypothetical protein